MASDLKLDIDGIRLNVRVGAIIRYKEDVVIEISKLGLNSVVPGGRIKINEKSTTALKRELKEELDFEIDENKLTIKKVFENFFNFNGNSVHEIYFLYEYNLSDDEFKGLKLEANKDNETTYFKLVNKFEIDKYNLLPLELHDIIQK